MRFAVSMKISRVTAKPVYYESQKLVSHSSILTRRDNEIINSNTTRFRIRQVIRCGYVHARAYKKKENALHTLSAEPGCANDTRVQRKEKITHKEAETEGRTRNELRIGNYVKFATFWQWDARH